MRRGNLALEIYTWCRFRLLRYWGGSRGVWFLILTSVLVTKFLGFRILCVMQIFREGLAGWFIVKRFRTVISVNFLMWCFLNSVLKVLTNFVKEFNYYKIFIILIIKLSLMLLCLQLYNFLIWIGMLNANSLRVQEHERSKQKEYNFFYIFISKAEEVSITINNSIALFYSISIVQSSLRGLNDLYTVRYKYRTRILFSIEQCLINTLHELISCPYTTFATLYRSMGLCSYLRYKLSSCKCCTMHNSYTRNF